MTPRDRALLRVERLLRRGDCDTIGIDLRLLLPLPLWQEADLYALMNEDARETAGTALMDFVALRLLAEGKTLEEVYADLSERLLGRDIRPLAARERELRLRLPVVAYDVLALMNLARDWGRRVVLFMKPPSMLTNGDVQRMLAERRLPQPEGLCFDTWTEDLNRPGTLVVCAEKPDHAWRSVTLPSAMIHWPMPPGAMESLGVRTMMAMASLHPGCAQAQFAAYGALGMALFSMAIWLAEECCRAGLSRLIFLARDGFLVRRAFDQVREALDLPIATGYLRTSPQAVLPLHLRAPADVPGLSALLRPGEITPRTLLDALSPVTDAEHAILLLTEAGFIPDAPMSERELHRFLQIFQEKCFNQGKCDAYLKEASAYLAKWAKGRCATFGAGEDLFVEEAIARATGANLTAFAPFLHGEASQFCAIDHRAMISGSPAIRGGTLRQFLEEENAPCLRYEGGKAVRGETPPPSETLTAYRTQALTFVNDMVRTFGEDIAQLAFRPADGFAAFELFLLNAPWQLTETFLAPGHEDAVLAWRLQQADAHGGALRPLRRILTRLRHSPKGFWRHVKSQADALRRAAG